MTFDNRLHDDLVLLARAGCGFTISGRGRLLPNLIRIAEAAREGNAKVTMFGMSNYSTQDLISIGRAGAGNITFDDS